MACLIGFDKNRENLQFKGHSKLSINFMSNYLFVEPQNEEFKMISASFKWNYVIKKNLLFVFAEHDFMDFCLVFRNEQICQKILDNIISVQRKITKTTDECIIDNTFINPIFKAIADNSRLNSDLIKTITKWHQLLEKDEKEKYSTLMRDYGIYDQIVSVNQIFLGKKKDEKLVENRKRKFAKIWEEKMTEIETEKKFAFPKIIPSSQFDLIYRPCLQYRKMFIYNSENKKSFHEYRSKLKMNQFRCINCGHCAMIDFGENDDICLKIESKKHSCKPPKKAHENYPKLQLLRKPDYQIFENCSRKFYSILVVFDPDNRNQCYEYFWIATQSYFGCCGCQNVDQLRGRKRIKANVYNEGTKKEYVETLVAGHVCEKRKFEPKKYQPYFDHVLRPNFEIQKIRRNGKEGQRLIIFDVNDKTKCYWYFFDSQHNKFHCVRCAKKGRSITAKLQKNLEDEEYVILSNVKHVCELKPYVSNHIITLCEHEDFEVMEETKYKYSVIFVFLKNDRTKCHIFQTSSGMFYCVGCAAVGLQMKNQDNVNTKKAHGRLAKNEKTGKYTFQINLNQNHICEPRPYEPEKYKVQSIPKTYDFFFYRLKSASTALKIAIPLLDDNEKCFTFLFQKFHKVFLCMDCKNQKNYVQVKLEKDANGKEFVIHDWEKHICKPIKVSSICPPRFVLLKEHGLNFKPKIKIDDEKKVVRMPNFELRPNKDGIPEKKLIVFHPTDKNLCYDYHFVTSHQNFQCGRCRTKNACVSAKLHKDESNNEECFILMGKNDHVCEPVKVSAFCPSKCAKSDTDVASKPKTRPKINESKIVKIPNFELRPSNNGDPDKKLIILHSIDKSLCYIYGFSNTKNKFECRKCHWKKVYVSAKLHKDDENGESFIVMGKNDHVCEPSKYQSL